MSRAARAAVAVAAVVTAMWVPHDAAVTEARAAACISADRSFGCPRGRGMENPFSLALAPDGRTLYVPSDTEATAAVLRVNPRTGVLRQSAGRDGCLAGRRVSAPDGPFGVRYAASCTRVRGIAATVKALRVSPDGRHLYVISAPSQPQGSGVSGLAPGLQAVAVLARRADGTYSQPAGRSGCVANQPRDGCAVRPTLRATDISISADGRHVYLAGSSTVTVMARDRRTGTLTWRSCLGTGKAAAGCAPLPLGITYPGAPAFAPDGRTAYLDSATYSRARKRQTGLLLALTREPPDRRLDGARRAHGLPGVGAVPRLCRRRAPARDRLRSRLQPGRP